MRRGPNTNSSITMQEAKGSKSSLDITRQDPLLFVENVEDGEHGCLLYLKEWDKQKILFHFLKKSLSDGYYCVYATATQSVEEAKKSMKMHGLNSDSFLDSLRVVRGEELYNSPDEPDTEKWLASIEKTYEAAIRNGKKGLKIAADLSSYFLNNGLVQQWFDLESSLEAKLKTKVTIICAYDASEAPSTDALSVIHFYKNLDSSQETQGEAHNFAVIPLDFGQSMIVRF